MKARDIRALADNLFSRRSSLTSLWQEQAEHFYPERADFTYRRSLGSDFAADLMTSYPIVARRELAQQIGMMLRRPDQEWFYMVPADEDRADDPEAKAFLERANIVQRRAMYDRGSLFERASVEADHDWSTFGQYCMSVRLNRANDGLLYRLWHLRDVAWMEDEEGRIPFVARRWKPQLRELVRLFGDKNHASVAREAEQEPFRTVDCLHVMCEADLYDDDARGRPWFSLYIDCEHGNHLIEAVPQRSREYVIPRWQTVSGSQYAYSPATVAALPDARLIQAMTLTLLEAGEKTTNPPMVGTTDAVKSDVSIYAGGITWVDRDYDERLGNALRPLTQDYARGLPFGLDMLQDTRSLIHQAFYLNKVTMPQAGAEMTATEVHERVQEYIRGALPIFAPMEPEANGQICELTFEILMANGAFGSPFDMPRSLRGRDVEFHYRSPLHDALEMEKANTFRQGAQLLAEAAAIDPTAPMMVNGRQALRDALEGIRTPQEWLRTDREIDELQRQRQEAEQAQSVLDQLEQGGRAAESIAGAEQSLAMAGAR